MLILCWEAQIEDSLLTDAKSTAGQQTGGRSRAQRPALEHVIKPAISSDMDSWAELASLYMELGLDHFAQTSYSSHIAQYDF